MPKSAKKKDKTKQKAKVSYLKNFLHYIYCLTIIALLILTSINIESFISKQKVLGATIDTTPLQNEKSYWQNMIATNPSYIDGYLEVAKVDVELGNKIEAQSFINKALILDPNSSKIPEVETVLGL